MNNFITSLETVYNKFRVHFYMQIFYKFEKREATLTMVEAFSMECIMLLNEPTIAEFANMMNISAPNAAYRVNSLLQKGYITKLQSKEDQREYYIKPTEKFIAYYDINNSYLRTINERCKKRFSKEEYDKFAEMLSIINNELMPELNLDKFKKHPDQTRP